MAYIQNANDPNEQNVGAMGAPTNMNQLPSTATGSGAGAVGATGGPQGTSAVPTSTQAPPVQDLKAYLAANAPQAVQMGQNIAGNLNQAAGKVTGDINAAQTDIANQVAAQNVAPNTDLVNKAAANPTEFVKNPNDLKDFLAQENANYTGPASFESTPYSQTLTNEVQNAMQGAPDINKPGGVDQLVRAQEQNPTLGMENLDTLLLQGNPEAMAPIQGAIGQYANIPGQLTNAQNATDKAIQDAILNDQAARVGVQNAFLTGPNAVVPEWQKALQNELQTDIGQVNTYNEGINALPTAENAANPKWLALQNAVKEYNAALANSEKYPAMGITGNPLSFGNVTNPSLLTQPTLAQAATPQDIEMQNALEMLLGGNFNPQFDATGVTPFQSPGNAPTLKDLANPLISEFTKELANINPRAGAIPALQGPSNTNYASNVDKAYQDLLDYLGYTVPIGKIGPGVNNSNVVRMS